MQLFVLFNLMKEEDKELKLDKWHNMIVLKNFLEENKKKTENKEISNLYQENNERNKQQMLLKNIFKGIK